MTKRTLEEKVNHYFRHGHCPVDTSHLPEVFQGAFNELNLQPQMKDCFANCQKFVIRNLELNTPLEIEYHEGYVTGIIPFEHAWLVWEDQSVDLTLEPADDEDYGGYIYHDSFVYTELQVRKNIIETEMWTSLTSFRDFASIHPFFKQGDTRCLTDG